MESAQVCTDKEDEKPTVVVMKDGDLNEEEAREEEKSLQKAEEEKLVAEGKIAFKKPTKRENSDKGSEDDQVKKTKSCSQNRLGFYIRWLKIP